MARVRKKSRVRSAAARGTARAPSRLPADWPILGLAGLGVLLTVYLLVAHLSGGDTLFCTAGSACDIVQESRWSVLFGVPVALWGLGLYGLIAFSAATGRRAVVRWRRLFTLALIGVLISVYLTLVGWFALETFCPWCMLSLALVTAIFVWVVLKRPAQTPAAGWSRWLVVHALVLLPALGVIAGAQAGWLSPPADPRLELLAEHLETSGAKYYGTFWCPTCQKQRRLFGRAAEKLPYVECTPNGRTGPIAFECASQSVESFPTWVIRGQRYTGVLSADELARHSNFRQWNAPKAE